MTKTSRYPDDLTEENALPFTTGVALLAEARRQRDEALKELEITRKQRDLAVLCWGAVTALLTVTVAKGVFE